MNYGRYRVVEELGHGSMGVVYRAHDPVIGRTVAIKVVRDLPWLSPEQREAFNSRFRSEAEAAGALHHPSIVTLFDVGEGYLVMEFVEGQTLSTLLRARQRLPLTQVLGITAQVADALDFAHGKKAVHREVKPANIMMLPDGGVKVLDFGVARPRFRDAEGEAPLLGSAAYMAPEQLLGQRAEPSADIFSLGVVVYELLTGERPFGGTSEAAIVEEIKGGSPASLCKLNPSLPTPYESIMLKALSKDPGQRFEKAGLFVAALREAMPVEGEAPVSAPTPSSAAHATSVPAPPAAVFRLPVRALIAAAVLLGVVSLLWLVRPRTAPVVKVAVAKPAIPSPPAAYPYPEPAAPTARPTTSRAVLLVTTQPTGARIFVGGEEKGQAPITLTDPPAGPMVVRAEKEAYLPAARLVIVSPGQSQGLSLDLDRPGVPPTTVDILSMPEGGTLSIDGVVAGQTNAGLSLPPGIHVVEIRKEGFDVWVQEVEVGGEPRRIIATLEKKAAAAPPRAAQR